MAFPVVEARGQYSSGPTGGIHTISLPAGVGAGDMILVAMSSRGVGTYVTSMTGWTLIRNGGGGGWAVAWRKATGAETDFESTWDDSNAVAALVWVFDPTSVTDWTVERPPEITTYAWTSSEDPDSPSHTTSWREADNLWISATRFNTGSTGLAYPAGFTQGRAQPSADSGTHYPIAAAEVEATTIIVNPGAFDAAGTNPSVGVAGTIAVSPKDLPFINPPPPPDPTFDGNVHIHDGGTWVSAQNFHVKNSDWETVKKVWISDGTGWVLAWENEITETFAFVDGMTFKEYNTTDDAGFRARTPSVSNPNIISIRSGWSHDYVESYGWYNRGLWIPNVGSVTGDSISTALLNRTLLEFKVSLGLDSSGWNDYDGDGYPARMSIWGSNYASVPADLNPSELVYLGTVAFYPLAYDYDQGFATITQSMLDTNPPASGDRTPVFYQDIDLFSQLDANAKTKLTNGFIKSFIIQAYYYDDSDILRDRYHDHSQMTTSLFPGEYYDGPYWETSKESTGNADAFRIKVTHTGQA